ncbi:lysyl-tRNA synthetase, class 2 [Thiothrix eikelboomii]|uniref:Lysyl-tRNA synthetase, class 2 n=1 Tax=Thiothrix eikelboomii TaxID=92487 RepID=A0A1T4XLL2_9GAMM|nr:EF-P lysine aminoacylase EpmA [Thiothrix eikelboomii]SKA90273.1 lysyl-tRNA synthetase, class 2 [Thiothrix eikelboomii]
MNWQPTASIQALKARACLYQQLRAFFHARGVLEVETPALSQAGNTDPQISSFSVNTPQGLRYLHTSPEYPMKRLLAAGSGDIYQLCKVWRQDEAGRKHNPEFTMLEYYRVGFTYQQLMQEVTELLHLVLPQLTTEPRILSYRQAFLEILGLDPHQASIEQLKACAQQQQLDVQGELSQQAWLDLLFTHCIEASFPNDRLTFICHYPAKQAALARVRLEEGQWVAERFEVYLGPLELGNGYQEQTDAAQLERVLVADAKQQTQALPLDLRFIAAVQAGLPFSAGIALGVDRILLCRLQAKQLPSLLSFAWELA